MTTLFRKFLPAAVAVLLFFTLAALYFAPQFGGDVLPQHDVRQYEGASREIHRTREAYGEDPQWIGSMFGGMPAYLVDVRYPAQLVKDAAVPLTRAVPIPAGLIFFAMCAFWVMLRMMKIDPWVGIVPSLAYGLSTYFLLIIGAGHLTKMWALVYAPPMMGGIWMTLRGGRPGWGGALTALFASLEIGANHPQITYYFLLAAALFWLSEGIVALREKLLKPFAKRTAVLAAAGLLALGSNFAPLWYTAQHAKDTTRSGSELAAGDAGSGGLDLAYATAWSYGRAESLEPADPRFHGQRLGPRLLGGRPRRRGADALRHGAGGAAGSPPTGANSPTPAGPPIWAPRRSSWRCWGCCSSAAATAGGSWRRASSCCCWRGGITSWD